MDKKYCIIYIPTGEYVQIYKHDKEHNKYYAQLVSSIFDASSSSSEIDLSSI